MKTLKFFGSTVLICLFVVACAKTKKEEEARISGPDKGKVEGDLNADGGNSRDGNRTKPKFDITKDGYTSKTLKMDKAAEGSAETKAELHLEGKDAMELYERMRITEKAANNSASDMRYLTQGKAGKNYSCFKYELVDSKDKAPDFKCQITFDSRTGKILQNKTVTLDETIAEKTTNYPQNPGEAGSQLTITPNKGKNEESVESTGLITITGDDARVLFDTLTAKEQPTVGDSWSESKVKFGANVRCYEDKNPKKDTAAEYRCSLSINAVDGTIKATDTSTAAAATPEDDGKEDGDQTAEPAAPASPTEPSEPEATTSSVKASHK